MKIAFISLSLLLLSGCLQAIVAAGVIGGTIYCINTSEEGRETVQDTIGGVQLIDCE